MADNPFNQSSNPFESPVEAKPVLGAQSVPPVAPGGLTPILVICLILGVFGLMGSCMGGVVAFGMPYMADFIQNSDLPEQEKAKQVLSLTAQKPAMIPTLIQSIVNLFVASLLVIGAIGCFKRKESSRGLLRTGLLGAIFFSFLKIGLGIYVYFATAAAMKVGLEKLQSAPNFQAENDPLADFSQIFGMIGMGAGVLFAVGLLIFYFWARSYLGKPSVEQHFAEATQYRLG